MQAPTRALGPARITALALIAIAALGLAYLHFGTGDETGAALPAALRADAEVRAWHIVNRARNNREEQADLAA